MADFFLTHLSDLWIPITVFAAFMQNLRSALQKHIRDQLSVGGAAYVRFLYAMPFALLYLAFIIYTHPTPLPTPTPTFWLYVTLGGIAQIMFTFLLVAIFAYRNFAVGTTFSKTDVIQVAILGLIILGDTISLLGVAAIAIGAVGILVLSAAQTKISIHSLLTGVFERSALLGLLSGAFLGASTVFFRGASLSLNLDNVILSAAITLACALIVQTVVMGVYLHIREPGQLRLVFVHWPRALPVGIAGVLASIAWFTAFTIENAAYVRAVGQIELLFTFAVSHLIFKERTRTGELWGIAMILAGILLLVLYR